jgi:two-component system phosphate regulon sensor histidine kinase PhoR
VARIQLQLIAALGGLVLLVALVGGALAERGLHAREMRRAARDLERRARLAAELAGELRLEARSAEQLDAIADRAGAAAGARVTWIDASGAVLGDSELPLARLAEVESQAQHPEVAEALAGRVGTGTLRSDRVGRSRLTLAIPLAGGGALRLAAELPELEAEVAGLRRALAGAAAIGLLAALALGYGVALLALAPVRELRRIAESVAEGDLAPSVPLRASDEFGEIAVAIRRMAEQLRERLDEVTREKEQLRAVLDGMGEGVLVVDAGGLIIMANERLRDLYGVRGEILGRTPLSALRDAALDEALSRAVETDEPVSCQIPAGPRGLRTLGVHAVRFPSGRAPRTGTVAVLRDVTEAARLDRMRRDFVANASHELRTPLAAVRGFAETLLANGSLSAADRRSYLEIIDRHARRLGSLVDDLLELSRIESGDANLQPTRVDVAALVDAWLRDAKLRVAERRLAVSQHAEGPALAWADRRAVEQILANLLENAIRYTEPGGRIDVRTRSDERWVRIDVEDTGVGIPAADLDRIFERFYRVDKARSREHGGTGLGLSIVKHLVQGSGGRIQVRSEPGRGSTFSVTLPRAQAPERD